MPKYKPTPDDLYDTTPCFFCGDPILEEGAETCGSDMCRMWAKSYAEDEAWDQMKRIDEACDIADSCGIG